MDKADVDEIVEEHLNNGRVVERLGEGGRREPATGVGAQAQRRDRKRADLIILGGTKRRFDGEVAVRDKAKAPAGLLDRDHARGTAYFLLFRDDGGAAQPVRPMDGQPTLLGVYEDSYVRTPAGFRAQPVAVSSEGLEETLVSGALAAGDAVAVRGIAGLKAALMGIGVE